MRSQVLLFLLSGVLLLNCGWVGVDVKPLEKPRSDLSPGQSGTYYQLSDTERKELVWMAKAANAAYKGEEKPLGYRSFTRAEWDACAENCSELRYTEDGYFTVGSGLCGRLMVNMVNEGRVVLALCGTEAEELAETVKDLVACATHYLGNISEGQYEQALRLMQGVLASKPRSELWIVGHSLGGSLATYLALKLPASRTKVKCATFNGYGVSPIISISSDEAKFAGKRIRNVYMDGDLIALVNKAVSARQFGPSYSLQGSGSMLEQHKLVNLLKQMIQHRTKWPGL